MTTDILDIIPINKLYIVRLNDDRTLIVGRYRVDAGNNKLFFLDGSPEDMDSTEVADAICKAFKERIG